MARIFMSGFELNSLTQGVELYPTPANAGTVTLSTTTVRTGTYSMRHHPTGGASVAYTIQSIFPTDQSTQAYQRVYLRIASMPVGGPGSVLRFVNVGHSVDSCRISLTTAGKLQLLNSTGGQIGSDSATLSLNTWYCVELRVDASTATGTAEGRLNGVSFANGNNNARGVWGEIGLGHNIVTAADIFFDDWALNDTTGTAQNSWCGEGGIIVLYPNGPGSVNTWNHGNGGVSPGTGGGLAGTSTNWTETTGIPPDDSTSYVRTISAGREDLYTFTNYSGGANDTVNVVAVGSRYRNYVNADNVGAFYNEIVNPATNARWTGSPQFMNVNFWWTWLFQLVTYTQPNSSTPWNVTALNGMQAGMVSTAGTSNELLISGVYITVDALHIDAAIMDNQNGAFTDLSGNRGIGDPETGTVTELISSINRNGADTAAFTETNLVSVPKVTADGFLNVLTDNQTDIETDATGWTSLSNCAVTQTTDASYRGSDSLKLTSSASGTMTAYTQPFTTTKVVVGQSYTAIAQFLAAANARTVRIDMNFYTSGSVFLSGVTGTPVSDATGAWTQATATMVAPATADFVVVIVNVLSTGGASEIHYVDNITVGSAYQNNFAEGANVSNAQISSADAGAFAPEFIQVQKDRDFDAGSFAESAEIFDHAFDFRTTDEYWDVDGIPLHMYTWNIKTIGGTRLALPPLRGNDTQYPYRPGKSFRPKMPDSRVITLLMWAAGVDPVTAEASTIDTYTQFNDNFSFLKKLFWTPQRQVKLTRRWLQGAHNAQIVQATALAQIAGTMEPTMTGRNRADFSVDLLLADPYFYGVEEQFIVPLNQETIIINKGDDDAKFHGVRLQFFGQLINAKLTNISTPHPVSVSVNTSINDGDMVELDVENYTATKASTGATVIGNIGHAGHRSWCVLQPGDNRVTLSGTGDGYCLVTFSPPYL